jgi:hypothetical protein
MQSYHDGPESECCCGDFKVGEDPRAAAATFGSTGNTGFGRDVHSTRSFGCAAEEYGENGWTEARNRQNRGQFTIFEDAIHVRIGAKVGSVGKFGRRAENFVPEVFLLFIMVYIFIISTYDIRNTTAPHAALPHTRAK